MKTLKLKSIVLGLMALFAVAIVMTSCEQDPLENISEASLEEMTSKQKQTNIQFDGASDLEDYIEGQFYVKLKDDYNKNFKSTSRDVNVTQLPFLNNLKSSHNFEVKSTFHFAKSAKLNRTLRVYLDDPKQADNFMSELKKSKEVEYAEKVPVMRASLTPNDLGANTNSSQWGLHKIQAQGAWDISQGSSNVVVAIVDDAISMTHPDLAGKIVNPRDVADGDNNTNPPSVYFPHGTHVAGIAGAATNNGTGVASIGYNVSIMPIKATHDTAPIIGCNGSCVFIYYGYEGVTWAANNGADVVNMSWGGFNYSQTAANVISAAAAKGVVLVAAAGNSNTSSTHYPSGYPNVISVAATDINDNKAGFSNYGSTIDVSAPGVSIRSTVISGGYQNWNGTSMASPMVAGLCGLVLSADPSLSPAQVENCIESTADPLNSSFALGAGRINALQALQCASPGGGGGEECDNDPVLSQYPFANAYVDANNCTSEKITVYNKWNIDWLIIETPNWTRMYRGDTGQLWCTGSNCVSAYGLTNQIATWECCDDGGVEPPQPCDNDPVLTQYPFANTYVDANNCTSEKITVYNKWNIDWLIIETPNWTRMYRGDTGQLWCTGTGCVSAYGLTNPIANWECCN